MTLTEAVRDAVSRAMDYWPNSHLGDRTRRQDMPLGDVMNHCVYSLQINVE